MRDTLAYVLILLGTVLVIYFLPWSRHMRSSVETPHLSVKSASTQAH